MPKRATQSAKPTPAPKSAAVQAAPVETTPAQVEERRGFIAEWTGTLVLLMFGTMALGQAFAIPTASMESTLLVGDHLIVDRMVYAPHGAVSGKVLPYEDLHRGDIIVFRYPVDITQNYVKRAIGVPGDHIKLVNKQLYLNGHAVNEPYVQHITSYIDPYRDNFPGEPDAMIYPGAQKMLDNDVVNGEVVVPPDSIFAMGDNRDNSLDSRYWGFVPRENLVGRPVFIYWSFQSRDAQTAESSGFDHMQDIVLHFFSRTRWTRMGRMVHRYDLH